MMATLFDFLAEGVQVIPTILVGLLAFWLGVFVERDKHKQEMIRALVLMDQVSKDMKGTEKNQEGGGI